MNLHGDDDRYDAGSHPLPLLLLLHFRLQRASVMAREQIFITRGINGLVRTLFFKIMFLI